MKKELTKKQRNLIISSSVIGLTALGSALISVPLTATNKTTIVSSTNQSKPLKDSIFLSNYKISDKNVNFNNLIQKTNLSKVDYDINLKLKNDINNFLEINNKNVNDQKIKEYQSLISKKAKLLAQEVYDKKISINTIMKENTKKFNAFPENERKSLEAKITNEHAKIVNNWKNKSLKNNLFRHEAFVSSFYLNNNFASGYEFNQANAKKTQEMIKNQLITLGVFASAMTAAAIATGIVASILFTIPFYGWFISGPATTAAAVTDGIAAGLGWAAFANINNIYTKVLTGLTTVVSIGYLGSDINGDINIKAVLLNLRKYQEIAKSDLSSLDVSSESSLAANYISEVFDPANVSVVLILSSILTFLDAAMSAIGVASLVIACV